MQNKCEKHHDGHQSFIGWYHGVAKHFMYYNSGAFSEAFVITFRLVLFFKNDTTMGEGVEELLSLPDLGILRAESGSIPSIVMRVFMFILYAKTSLTTPCVSHQ